MSSPFSAAAATPTLTLRILSTGRSGCRFVVIPCSISVRGHGDEARMLREAGIDVTAFEPYENDGHERISFDRGRRSAEGLIHAVRSGKRFTSLFLSSVLNSVPFVSDREHIVCICAALCDGDSTLYASARSTKGANWQCHTRGPGLNEHGMYEGTFRVAWERGSRLGISAWLQKYRNTMIALSSGTFPSVF